MLCKLEMLAAVGVDPSPHRLNIKTLTPIPFERRWRELCRLQTRDAPSGAFRVERRYDRWLQVWDMNDETGRADNRGAAQLEVACGDRAVDVRIMKFLPQHD
jgi:hypothetical protein